MQNSNEAITLQLKDQGGEVTFFKVKPTTRLGKVFTHYAERKGTTVSSLRFYGDGQRLFDETVSYYEIEDGDQIDVIVEQVGMISTFTTKDETTPETKWLMMDSTDEERAALILSAEYLMKVMEKKGASTTKRIQVKQTGETLLSVEQRKQIMRFMDAVHDVKSPGIKDLKIVLGESTIGKNGSHAFMTLLGIDSEKQYDKIIKTRSKGSGDAKIALRRTEGPVDGCIGFHTDGESYATETVQLTLNNDSEYDGGRICFVTGKGKLTMPKRPAGTLTKHDRSILHGVTRLIRGVRYSLFVVDDLNGLGDSDVHAIGMDEIASILAQGEKRKYEAIAQKVRDRAAASKKKQRS